MEFGNCYRPGLFVSLFLFFCFQRVGLPVHCYLVFFKTEWFYLSDKCICPSLRKVCVIIAELEKLIRLFPEPGFSIPPIPFASRLCSLIQPAAYLFDTSSWIGVKRYSLKSWGIKGTMLGHIWGREGKDHMRLSRSFIYLQPELLYFLCFTY